MSSRSDQWTRTATRIFRTIWRNPNISRVDLAKKLGLDKSTVTKQVADLLENGLIEEKEEGEATAVRKLYGLTRPYLVFLVGSPEPRKNLRRTVEAARLGAPEFPLALIGPREPLRRELGSYSESVVFTGIVPEHHLPIILAGARISLYPSLYEGFGLPVLESMAAGAPVVASDRGSIPEVAGTAAILVDPEDVEALAHAISNLVQNEALRERMRQEGRRRAARFTWRKAAQETLALYRELL